MVYERNYKSVKDQEVKGKIENMKDEKQRVKGKYIDEYSKIINGMKVQITETTKIGRDYEVLSFDRDYNPALPFIPNDGTYVNTYTTNVKGKDVTYIETTVIENQKVVKFTKSNS